MKCGLALLILIAINCARPLCAQNQVFAAEFNQSNNLFGTINLYTGDFTSLGSYGSTLINDIAYSPDGVVYGIDNNALVTFNQTNAAITTVGNFGITGIESVAFQPGTGTLYAASQAGLFIVDPTTGAAISVGSFGNPTGLNNSGQNIRFAADGDLYDTNTSSNGTSTGLYRISLGSGAATYLGEVQNYNNLALANAGNILYGVSVNVTNSTTTQQTLITFNLNNLGDGSMPHSIDVTPLDGQANIPPNFNFSGGQNAAVVPEPGTYGILLLAFSLGVAFLRRSGPMARRIMASISAR